MTLRLVDCPVSRPEENLALDEALLRRCDAEAARGVESGYLRFWESPLYFVVLGVSSRLRDDVDVDRCAEDRIPILRRASGGGTVLQGPGCLNASLVLPLEASLRDVHRSYRFVLERCVEALDLSGVAMRGTSDLALHDRKFAGSAQKRTQRALLHHASVLYDFDLDLIPRYLHEPEKQPDYRRGRPHREFVVNLGLPAARIRERLREFWDARAAESTWEIPPVDQLIAERYGRREWTERF